MIVNFRVHEISRGAWKLTCISMLIIIKKSPWLCDGESAFRNIRSSWINAAKGASSRECIIWKLDRACTFCSCVGGSACVLIKLCGKLIYSLSDSTKIVKSPLLFFTKAVLTFYQKRRSSAHQKKKKKTL